MFINTSSPFMANTTANATDEIGPITVCLGLQHVEFKITTPLKLAAYFSVLHSIGMSATALIGNILIIFAVQKSRELRSSKNVLFATMSLTHLLVGIVVLPLNIVIRILETVNIHICPMKGAQSFASYLLSGWSLANVAFVSIDRYFAAAYPIMYRSPSRRRIFFKVLGFTWVLWVAILIPPFSGAVSLSVLNLISAGLIISWCVLVFGCYYKVTSAVALSGKKTRIHSISSGLAAKQRCKRSGGATILIMTVIFAICYAPWVLSSVIVAAFQASSETKYIVGRISELFIYMNSSLNPFIYCYRSLRLRAAVLATIGKASK